MKKDYKKQMEELYQLHLQSINPIDSNKNIIVFNQTKESDYRLYLVIKDPNNISLYKDESDNKKLYYGKRK